jgi:hypothetical protein
MSFIRWAVLPATVMFCAASSLAQSHNASASSAVVSYSSSRTGMDELGGTEGLDGEGAAGPAGGASSAAAGGGGQVEPSVKGWEGAPIAFGAGVSTLGVSVSLARSITRSTDLRVAGDFFSYSLTLENAGVNYDGNIDFRSVHAQVDWAPFRRHSFHVSPGVIFANGNQLNGSGTVPGGTSITVNDTNYYSDAADPLRGTGAVTFNRVGPMVTVGWGSWIPREGKHFSFPFELGFAYTGQPKIGLNVQGSVCENADSTNCSTVNTDPTFQENLNAQIKKVENDISFIRFFPLISGGVAYKF